MVLFLTKNARLNKKSCKFATHFEQKATKYGKN